jgi:NhaA family Na+:H+ antiporter
MHKKELFVVGIIAGIGFTVALFVAGEAFIDPVLQRAAKMGAMLR